MNIVEEIKEIVNKLNELDNYSEGLINELSRLDLMQQDLLHYIEINKISTNEAYRLVREIKNVRNKRRKVKNDINLIAVYNAQINKLVFKDNRQFLLTELFKLEKKLDKTYTNKIYTNEELESILKGEMLCTSNLKNN